MVEKRCRSSDICQSKAAKVMAMAMNGSAPAASRRCFWVRAMPPSASWRTDQPWSRYASAVQIAK